MDKQMPLMDVREALGKRVDAAHFADEATVITKNGDPRAVLISYEWFQKLSADLRPGIVAAGADLGQAAENT